MDKRILLTCAVCGAVLMVDEGQSLRFFFTNHRQDKTTGRVTGNCVGRYHRGRKSFTCNAAFSFEAGDPIQRTEVCDTITHEGNEGRGAYHSDRRAIENRAVVLAF